MRKIGIAALAILPLHAVVLVRLGPTTLGAFLSDVLQLLLGALLIIACLQAGQRSDGFARHFWRLTASSYCIWLVAQVLATSSDLFHQSDFTMWTTNLLFCFWFVPLGMALFLDPEREQKRFDSLFAVDIAQAILFCIATYLFFYYIPRSESRTDLAHSVWPAYFIGYGLVSTAFVLRAFLTHSLVARKLMGRMGVFLLFSGCMDAVYYYGPGQAMSAGMIFDIAWSSLLVIPLLMAATWQSGSPEPLAEPASERGFVLAQLFPLFYPLLVLTMSVRIAKVDLRLAAAVVLVAFVCSTLRQLIIHDRLLTTQQALRREALHDGLTELWNRIAILDIFEKELLRGERTKSAVGVIMVDIDHFKLVNDTHGHAAGDTVLRIVCSEIEAVLRPYDAMGRYGGEEFLIVAPGCAFEETWNLAERIRSAVASCEITVSKSKLAITLSLGIASSGPGSTTESLLHAADGALYRAKNGGRNRVEPAVHGDGRLSQSKPEVKARFWL